MRIGGVKVGTVVEQRVDQEDYLAVVTMTVRPDIKLPKNTLVTVSSDGLLGGKYIKLEPSTDGEILASGGELTSTRDVISLEELLGKVIFLVTDDPRRWRLTLCPTGQRIIGTPIDIDATRALLPSWGCR